MTAEPLPTFDGSPAGPHHYHVGYPLTDAQILAAVKAGRKVYLPDDPRSIDQRPYVAYAVKRAGGESNAV